MMITAKEVAALPRHPLFFAWTTGHIGVAWRGQIRLGRRKRLVVYVHFLWASFREEDREALYEGGLLTVRTVRSDADQQAAWREGPPASVRVNHEEIVAALAGGPAFIDYHYKTLCRDALLMDISPNYLNDAALEQMLDRVAGGK